ncbi:hypothetical protein Tco_0650844 [Tanacetum coccineum]
MILLSLTLSSISDEDFTSSDESFSEEGVPNENFKIFSNPLFDLDEEITSAKVDQMLLMWWLENTSINDSQKIDSLLDEFAGELTLLHSIPPGIDDVNLDPEGDILFLESLLYDNSSPCPPEEFNYENPTESFSLSPIRSRIVDSLYGGEIRHFSLSVMSHATGGDSTIDVEEDIPVDVPNILPTHPAFLIDFDFIPSNDLGSDLDNSSPSGDRNKIVDPWDIALKSKYTRILDPLPPVIGTFTYIFIQENEGSKFPITVFLTAK